MGEEQLLDPVVGQRQAGQLYTAEMLLAEVLFNNNNKFNFYIAQFPFLAQSASHKNKKELIDKKIYI